MEETKYQDIVVKNSELSIDARRAMDVGKIRTLSINKSTTIMALVIIVLLVVVTIVLAYTLPMGAYARYQDADGDTLILENSYSQEGDFSRIAWWKVILSPFLVLGANGSVTLIAIMALLLVIGAVFNALDETQILRYMVNLLKHKYYNKKMVLLFLIPLLFMFLATAAGVFEEIIPLVPIIVLLCYGLGWDSIVALAISVLPAAFGYAASVVNPFTIGIAQKLLNVQMFSGVGMRLLTFAVLYILLMAFVIPYVKRIEKHPEKSLVYKEDRAKKLLYNFDAEEFVYDARKSKALTWVGSWFLSIIGVVIISIFINGTYIPALGNFVLADYVLYFIVAVYVIAGLGACVICGFKGKALLKALLKGLFTLFPVVGLVLIVSGMRYIIDEGNVTDTIIYYLIENAQGKSTASVVIIIYLAVLVLELFISSGSAKAFLIMPIIGVICQHIGIHPQVAALAFIYGDGLVNTFMPTNAGLLLMLGMTTVSYPKWFRWNLPLILLAFGATCGLLMLAHFVVYA